MNEQFTQIKNSLVRDINITSTQFRIISYLLSISKNGIAFPSIRTMARELSISPSTIFRNLEHLENKKYLKKTNVKTKNGKKASNQYRLKKDLFIIPKKTKLNTDDFVDYDWLIEEIGDKV